MAVSKGNKTWHIAFRCLYVLLTVAPIAIIIGKVWNIYHAALPQGFDSPNDFIIYLLTLDVANSIRILVNFLLYLLVCWAGFCLFTFRWKVHDKRLLLFAAIGVVIFVVQLPMVYGINTLNILFHTASFKFQAFWQMLKKFFQLQGILTAATTGAILKFYFSKEES